MKAVKVGSEIYHHGVKGMHWGVRRTPEQLGHHSIFSSSEGGNYNSDDTVFISGKIKYDKPIDTKIKNELDRIMNSKAKIVIGDAPGADTRVQEYLSDSKYKNVTVYSTDDNVRNNVGNWNVKYISGNGKTNEREIRRQKDIAMTEASTKGMVISSDDDDSNSATSLNVQRLIDSNKSVQFYDFKTDELRSNKLKHSEDDECLMHYGRGHLDGGHSGRYEWGSGADPIQRKRLDFIDRVDKLKKEGWTETKENIEATFGLKTSQYRVEKAIANDTRRMILVNEAKKLAAEGMGPTDIGKILGKNESTVRSLLNSESEMRMKQAANTAEFLKKQVDKKGMIDVGNGVEYELNISKEKLNQALNLLEAEGYPVYKGGIPQVTNKGKQITQTVLCPPGTEHKEIYEYDKVNSLNEYISRDEGMTYEKKFHYPKSMDSSRLMIRYADDVGPDGVKGIEKDGIIELRRGVDDLSLNGSRYSQVRILVDDKKYLKGMAVYSDDMPDGVDVVFNTNKKSSVPKMDVLKSIKDDKENPFGSAIKDAEQGGQYWYTDKNGNKQLGLINKRADEGDWTEWKDKLPAQFLSKQSVFMAKKQLGLSIADKEAEYDEIKNLTNPTVKKYYLKEFADSCDKAAVNLQAAALPGQKYHVIIPINSLKDNEVFAPRYQDGTNLALIRYPHGGIFEIPIVTVNNKNKVARNLIGTDAIDAVGINSKVAERLSGADFDGDTVMCIPTHDKEGKVKIASSKQLDGLIGFDPKTEYSAVPGMQVMTKGNTQLEMGKISNLITDMTLKGANGDELARAVRHSMVVIDAEKHKLNYKQSEIDNGINDLKKLYQIKYDEDGVEKYGGASTLISRSKGEKSIDKRQGNYKINMPGTEWYDPTKPDGARIWKEASDLEYTVKKVNKRTGEITYTEKHRLQQTTNMDDTEDARTLISDYNTKMENVYADYANSMKGMANRARVELYNTPRIAYSPSANKAYKNEVDSLDAKLGAAVINAPKERQAQRMANVYVDNSTSAYKDQNGEKMSKSDVKKLSQRSIARYRDEVGSISRRNRSILITDKEWEAIQAGAITENKLNKILRNSDPDALRERATPRTRNTVSDAKKNQIKAMGSSNYTIKQIAEHLGLPESTVAKYVK